MVDVIIPTYRPKDGFYKLIKKLASQTVKPHKVIIMNTLSDEDGLVLTPEVCDGLDVEIHDIKRSEFDHGGTRDKAVRLSEAEFCVLMTQDALPVDDRLIEAITAPFEDPRIAISFARQVAYEHASPAEKMTREFNYPAESSVRSVEDLEKLQIKTYFCSNVACAYRKSTYMELDGFVNGTIFNEDMIYAAKALKAGYKLAYAADAIVFHSHDYSGKQQFKRNFDNGVSHADHPEVFSGVKQEGEGMRMVKYVCARLAKEGHALSVPGYIYHTGCKFIGFKLGCRYKRLPKCLVYAFSSDRNYFKKQDDFIKRQ
ncbi:MAG: glycosyltransferase family 2 protein [Lachnospiraceae bacterium]|nr:glycosyltransferase family 2 protein [Lachnospiraceae bacterium]